MGLAEPRTKVLSRSLVIVLKEKMFNGWHKRDSKIRKITNELTFAFLSGCRVLSGRDGAWRRSLRGNSLGLGYSILGIAQFSQARA